MREFAHNLSITQGYTPRGFRTDLQPFSFFPLTNEEAQKGVEQFQILLPKRLITGLRMLYGENATPKDMFLGVFDLDKHTLTPFLQTQMFALMERYRGDMYKDFVYDLEFTKNPENDLKILYDYSGNPRNLHHGIALEQGGRIERTERNPNITKLPELQHFHLHDVHGNDRYNQKNIGIIKLVQPWLNPDFKRDAMKLNLIEPQAVFREEVFASRYYLNKAFVTQTEMLLVA